MTTLTYFQVASTHLPRCLYIDIEQACRLQIETVCQPMLTCLPSSCPSSSILPPRGHIARLLFIPIVVVCF